jgi:hypothetical protein
MKVNKFERTNSMKPNTCLLVDVWEGQLEIDEAVLKANGVAGLIIRINDMNGGHHKDIGFDKQWAEAINFIRLPYFVYNPWVNGPTNFDWLKANMPAEATSVAIDIEVAYSGYSALTYAGEVNKFSDLCTKQGWKTIIYTGQGYLQLLSKWPVCDYWWAQYPSPSIYFAKVKTWEDLKISLDKLSEPFNANLCPGNIKLWQFSGDFLVLPGTTRKIDVNLFFGNELELGAYFGITNSVPAPATPPIPESAPPNVIGTGTVATNSLNERSGPGTNFMPVISTISKGSVVSIFAEAKDNFGNPWIRIGEDLWVCEKYGKASPYVVRNSTIPAPGPVEEWAYILDDALAVDRPTMSPDGGPRKGIPATVVLWGGAGDLHLTDLEMAYWDALNPDPKTQVYLKKDASGWHNSGAVNNLKKIGFACNVVQVTGRDGNKVFVKTHLAGDPLPALVRPTIDNLSPIVHFFTEAYDTWADISTDGRWPIVFLISRPNEESYFLDTDLAPYKVVDQDVKVTTLLLNIRLSPSTKKGNGFKLYGQTAHIYGIVTIGDQKWGRTGLNTWIALYFGGSYLTNWRP